MAKSVGTTHNVLKVFGIKIFEYYSDYICNETIEDVETLISLRYSVNLSLL